MCNTTLKVVTTFLKNNSVNKNLVFFYLSIDVPLCSVLLSFGFLCKIGAIRAIFDLLSGLKSHSLMGHSEFLSEYYFSVL